MLHSVECKLHHPKLTGGKRAHRKAGTLAGAPAGSPEGPKEAAADSRHRAPKGRRGQRRAGGPEGQVPLLLSGSVAREGRRALT